MMRVARRYWHYGVAIGSTAIALLLTLWLKPLLSLMISPLFYIAIIVSAWYGGFRAGFVSVVLSTLAIAYFFLPPFNQFGNERPEDLLQLGFFLLVALIINLLGDNFQKSKKKVERLSQQLLQENAAQLRMALSAARMGMWDWNIVTGEIKWSPEHEQLFGLVPGTFDGKYETFDDRLHPDDREGLNRAIQQALQTRSLYQHEYRIIWPDGSLHWVEGRGRAFYDDAAGQAVRMTGTIINIDDRKQTEILLHQQFEQQRLVMEMTQRIRQSLNLAEILQTSVDEMRQFLQCDRVIVLQFSPGWAGEVIVESVRADWMALLPLQIYDPCIGEKYVEPLKQGLVTAKSDIHNSGLSPCHMEFLANFQVKANLVAPILKNNELWGLLAAHHCEAPRQWQPSEIELLRQVAIQTGIAIQQADLFEQVQTELRERKLVESALRESQIQLQRQLAEIETIYQSAPIGLNIVDANLRFVRINQRLAEINGFSIEAHIGRTVRELLPELADTAEQILLPILETGEPLLNVEITGETPAQPGVQRIWLESFWPLKDGDRIIGISTVCEEITERKQAQLALQQLNVELEERVRLRTVELTEMNDRLFVALLEKERAYLLLEEQAQLLDLAHDSIIARDLNGVVTFWNQGAKSMYGWLKAEALGQDLHAFLKTQFPKPLAEIQAELLEKGYWEGELIHFTWDDRPVTVASRWVLQNDNTGKPIKILEINNDITQQKQAELALQKYSREVEDLYNNAPCGYHSLDAKGTIIRINNTELNWLGYSRDEVLYKKKFLDFLTPESQEFFCRNFPQFKQQGWIENLEFQTIGKDGSTRWLNVNATAIKDAAGNFLMSRSSLFDISDRKRAEVERKQAELALRESEESRRLALDLTNTGFWDLDLIAGNLVWNDNHFTLLGLVPGAFQSNYQLWIERLHPEDRERVETLFTYCLEAGIDYEVEYRVVHPDGSVHWLMGRGKAIYNESGHPVRSLGVLLDISDRKRAEKALRQYERIVFNIKDGIALLDRHYIYQIANQGYLSWCNKSESELLGNTVRNILGPELFDNFIKARLDRCLAGETIQYERWFDYPNLVPQFLSVTYTPYRDTGEKISGVIVSLRDLTKLKQAEELLQQSELTLRSFFNSAAIPMGIVELHDEDILHISDNWAAAQFFGNPTEAMQNQFASVLGVSPATIHRWTAYYKEAQQTQAPVRFEYCHTTDDGQRWLSGSVCPIAVSSSKYPRFSYIVEDISDRKQAEQMLELQAVITRNMAEGICLVRADNGIIVYANPKFEQIFGYDSGELNGQHVSIVNYASESVTAEEVNQAIRSAVLQNREATYQVHNVKKDGTPFWCEATTSVFRHPDYGDVLVAVQQDISDRKLAEETLQQQAKQEQLLFSMTQAIRESLEINAILNTAVSEVRQTLQADRAAVYRFNSDWSGDFVVESVTSDWVKLVTPDNQKVWEDSYLKETLGGRFQNRETLAVDDIYAAGLQPCHVELLEQFHAKAYAIAPIFSGDALWGLLAIYQNAAPRNWESWEIELLEQIANQLAIAIQQSELYEQLQIELHERKQTEAILREAERRWRFLLDNVQLIVVGLDHNGAVNYVNPFFLKLTGYAESEVLGKNWFDTFIPPSNEPLLRTVFTEVLKSNNHPYYHNSILIKSGEEKFIAWNNTFLRDSAGNTIGTVSIGEDITERQKIEHMKNEFIGIVSHELRTPLTSIRASLGLLKTGIYDKKPDKFKRMIEIASIDSDRLVRLVNDILDLERLESGRAVLEKAPYKAADLIEQAVEGVRAIADRQNITLQSHSPDLEVWAASDAIIQTLTNLLSNAIKFSPPETTITINVQRQTDEALFQVSDRGRGIPSDKLEAIFGRFHQVDASDSRDKGGTGLGLAICRSIIEQHGGRIWAESNLGAGSTFFFTLPLSLEPITND